MVISINCMVGLSDELVGSFVEVVVLTTPNHHRQDYALFTCNFNSGDSEDACPDLTWRCDLLKKIDLSHNRLRTLPDTFKSLRRLNTFTVSYNHLHALPPSMGLGCINLVSTCVHVCMYMYLYMYIHTYMYMYM